MRRTDDGPESRLLLPEMEREYGLEQLAERGEAQAMRDSHAAFFRDLAEKAEPYLTSGTRGGWLQRLGMERDNLRVALHWCLEGAGEREAGVRLAGSLAWFWFLRGDVAEGRTWLERALGAYAVTPGESTATVALHARALYGAAGLALAQASFGAAQAWIDQSVALFRQVGDQRRLAFALHLRGITLVGLGDLQAALPPLRECLALCRARQDHWGIAYTAQALALVAEIVGESADSQLFFDEAIALFQDARDSWGEAITLSNRAPLLWLKGDAETARAYLERSAALHRATGNRWELVRVLAELGHVLVQDDMPRAREVLTEDLRLAQDLGDEQGILRALAAVTALAAAQGQSERAARLCGVAIERLAGSYFGLARLEQMVADLRNRLGDETWTRLRKAGQALRLEDAIAEALDTLVPVTS